MKWQEMRLRQEGGREEGTRSSMVLEIGLSVGVQWGAMEGFRVRGGGHSALLLWAGSLITSQQHLGSCFYPKSLQGPKSPPSRPVRSTPIPRASHQACVVPVHTLRLLHHAGEAAGTGRGAGEVLQHFRSLGCSLRSATDSVPSAAPTPDPSWAKTQGPALPAQGGPSASSLIPWGLLYSSLGL